MSNSDRTSPRRLNPSLSSRDAVIKFGSQIAQDVKYDFSTSDLRRVVADLGGEIEIVDFVDLGMGRISDSGSLLIRSEDDFVIRLSDSTGVRRDNFTIGHELGHFLLHYLVDPSTSKSGEVTYYAERHGTGRIEWEANWFAAGFLMPEAKFRAAFDEVESDLVRLAARFSVSQSAAEIRVKQLGLSI